MSRNAFTLQTIALNNTAKIHCLPKINSPKHALCFLFVYRLLKNYVAQISDDKKYSITVVIGGTLHENDEFCIVLAYDDHAKTVRRRFKHISFEHFYSIQPISRFDDMNNALYLADNTLNININLPSSIKKKENENAALSDHSNVMAMEIDDVVSTQETKSMLNEVSNHENVTKLDEAKFTQKNVILIFNPSTLIIKDF